MRDIADPGQDLSSSTNNVTILRRQLNLQTATLWIYQIGGYRCRISHLISLLFSL